LILKKKKLNVSKNNYKITVEYEIEKEVKELGLEIEKLAFEIEVRKSGESLIAEFLKKSGEKFEFYDLFENFVNFYGKNK